MSIYCISDIHGMRDEFYAMLKEINFKEDDHLYILGDIIDRGLFGVKLFLEIMNMKNVTVLKGNHEDMCYRSMTSDMNYLKAWTSIDNGGEITRKQLMELDKNERNRFLGQISLLPSYKFVNVNNSKYLLVHAGISKTKTKTIEDSIKYQYSNLLWIRELFLKSSFRWYDCTIIFGHTVTVTIPWEIEGVEPADCISNWVNYAKDSYIWKNENKIGIDCGAVVGGRLACLRLDDHKEFYIEC